jgi:hypothetical protein
MFNFEPEVAQWEYRRSPGDEHLCDGRATDVQLGTRAGRWSRDRSRCEREGMGWRSEPRAKRGKGKASPNAPSVLVNLFEA